MRVIIESPYAGNVEENMEYLWDCVKDSLSRGEAPFASHGFYTQCLDDNNTNERKLGIQAGFAWGEAAELTVFYVDLGMSSGMIEGLGDCFAKGHPFAVRRVRD